MYWKLRIPLFLFLLGMLSGLDQILPNVFFVNTSYLIRRVVLIGLIGIVFAVLESAKVNEKKVHFTIGIGIVLLGFLFEFLTM